MELLELLEFLVELGLDGLLPLLAEVLVESVTTVPEMYCMVRADRPIQREDRGPLIAGAGFLVMGAAIGLNTLWLFPTRFTSPAHVFPGLSLLLAPLAAGLAMRWFGIRQRDRGYRPSRLATFWGGAVLAFAAALARFVMTLGR